MGMDLDNDSKNYVGCCFPLSAGVLLYQATANFISPLPAQPPSRPASVEGPGGFLQAAGRS